MVNSMKHEEDEKITVEIVISDEVKIKQRTILWYLVFCGFAINYCIRININIAIVEMIDENFRKTTNNSNLIIESECFEKLPENLTKVGHITSTINEGKIRFPSLERKLLESLGVKIVFSLKTYVIKQLIRNSGDCGRRWKN
jgi:hypothetical protein